MATPPTTPYCAQGEVAYFVRQLWPGTVTNFEFDNVDTIPSKTEVEFHITMVAAQIEAAFRGVGYKVPFVAKAGETWDASQTNFLKFLNLLGTAGIVGTILKPTPLKPERGRAQGNAYEEKFKELLESVVTTGGQGFRADAYEGTPADVSLSAVRAPQTTFGENIIDGADYLGMHDFTVLMADELSVWAEYGGADVRAYNYDVLSMWGKR